MRLSASLVALVAAFAPGLAFAQTTVRFAPVATVSSFEFRDVRERDLICRELARFLTSLGDRRLPPGVALTVDLLDLKPAGRLRPSTTSNVRVLSDVTPPQIRIRYALAERGRTVARGKETLTDLNYLQDVGARSSLASYPYEKELLRDWFDSRVIRRAPAR